MRWRALSLMGALGLVLAQDSFSGVEVIVPRDDNEIRIRNLDPSEGARSVLNNRNCKEGVKTSVFYGRQEGFVETFSDDARLISTVVVIEAPEDEDAGEQERVELFNAEMEFNRPRCPESVERRSEEKVRLEQGRTTVTGESFLLQPEENVGNMRGPVVLNRAAEGDSPALDASASELDFDFDTETSVLRGNVMVTSDDRSSEADELEYDEENAIAVMRGNPATSTDSEGFVQGDVIIYYLDTNDVIVTGNLAGEIEVDLGRGNGSAPVTPEESGNEFEDGFVDDFGGDINEPPPDPRQTE